MIKRDLRRKKLNSAANQTALKRKKGAAVDANKAFMVECFSSGFQLSKALTVPLKRSVAKVTVGLTNASKACSS